MLPLLLPKRFFLILVPQNLISTKIQGIPQNKSDFPEIPKQNTTSFIGLFIHWRDNNCWNVCPCKILSKSDEREPNAEPKILSILDLWSPAIILDFAVNEKFLRRIVWKVKLYVNAKFCPNLMNGNQMPSRNVIF